MWRQYPKFRVKNFINVRWLASVALFRYEDEVKSRASEPKIYRLESGHFVEMKGKICDIFHEGQNIWVILEDEHNPHGS